MGKGLTKAQKVRALAAFVQAIADDARSMHENLTGPVQEAEDAGLSADEQHALLQALYEHLVKDARKVARAALQQETSNGE